MKSSALLCLAIATVLTSASPTRTKTCTSVTHTAYYDDLPTGKIHHHQGLIYEGWEVVRATDTPFVAPSKPNLLRLTGTTGVIRPADPQLYVNDQSPTTSNGRSLPTFFFGCANSTSSTACEIAKPYAAPCSSVGCTYPPTFDLFFNANDYPHNLEQGGGFEPYNAHNITWKLTGRTGTAPIHLYLDNYVLYTTNCQG